jgi:hypothetical protein
MLAHSVDKHTASGTRLNRAKIACDMACGWVRFVSSVAFVVKAAASGFPFGL